MHCLLPDTSLRVTSYALYSNIKFRRLLYVFFLKFFFTRIRESVGTPYARAFFRGFSGFFRFFFRVFSGFFRAFFVVLVVKKGCERVLASLFRLEGAAMTLRTLCFDGYLTS